MSDDPADGPEDSFASATADRSGSALDALRGWFDEATTAEDGPDLDALTRRERGSLKRARAMGTLLDSAVPVPGVGYRVGIDPIVGLLPVSGDALGAVLSSHIIAEAAYAGVPPKTLVRMGANVALDAGVGSIPVAGDLFDAVWKANERNVSLFESHLADRPDLPVA